MGRQARRGRDVHGILLLDKPIGISSNDALQAAKRLLGARKAGHTGSLDKLASGLLPLCFGEATKISSFLLNADKHYLATFRLGTRTTTGDAEGEVVATGPWQDLRLEQIRAVLARFTGEIEQVPPMFSAIKHQGKPLYKLAHQGIEVDRSPRRVCIHRFDLLRWALPDLDVEVRCSKGTYIRTLAEDVGSMLGCEAHVAALRRIGSGPYANPRMYTLEELTERARGGDEAWEGVLLGTDSALGDWPAVELTEDMAFYLRQGQPILVPRAPTEGWVRLYAHGRGFLGVGEVLEDGRIGPRRLLQEDRRAG